MMKKAGVGLAWYRSAVSRAPQGVLGFKIG